MKRCRQALDGWDFGERETRGTGDSKNVDCFKEFCCKGKKRKGGVDEEECGLKGGCF